jgi:hypothetical protein
MAMGVSATTTAAHQIMLGTATEVVVAPGGIQSPSFAGYPSNSFMQLYDPAGVVYLLSTNNYLFVTNAGNGVIVANNIGGSASGITNVPAAAISNQSALVVGQATHATNADNAVWATNLAAQATINVGTLNAGTLVVTNTITGTGSGITGIPAAAITNQSALAAGTATTSTYVTTSPLTNNVSGTAASTTDAGTYWGAQATLGTNTLTLNNKYYYFNAANDTSITNLTVSGGCWAVLVINNTNAATTIHTRCDVSGIGIIGTVAYTANTNGLVVAAGKTAIYSVMSMSKTNYSNAVQQ